MSREICKCVWLHKGPIYPGLPERGLANVTYEVSNLGVKAQCVKINGHYQLAPQQALNHRAWSWMLPPCSMTCAKKSYQVIFVTLNDFEKLSKKQSWFEIIHSGFGKHTPFQNFEQTPVINLIQLARVKIVIRREVAHSFDPLHFKQFRISDLGDFSAEAKNERCIFMSESKFKTHSPPAIWYRRQKSRISFLCNFCDKKCNFSSSWTWPLPEKLFREMSSWVLFSS